MKDRPLVSRKEWLSGRKALLAEEKAMTRALDRLAEKRRSLPWVKVTEDYRFEGPDGQESDLSCPQAWIRRRDEYGD